MQSKFRLLASVIMLMAVSLLSCKKNETSTVAADLTTELTAQSDDQTDLSESTDEIENDANLVLESSPSFNGRIENVLGTLCNASAVADSSNGVKRITITYNGVNCNGRRSFTGVVILSMPVGTYWKDAGAVLTITTQNLKITRLWDNKSTTLNGKRTITNVTGGRLGDLASRGTITHQIAGSDSITFDNNKQRIWQVAKQRAFTYSNGIVITVTGMHTDGNISGIANWGTNRFGNAFVTAITQPLVSRQDCDYRLVSGQVTHSKLLAVVVVTFGLDKNGESTDCPGTGTYYFKSVWTGANGVTKTVILPY